MARNNRRNIVTSGFDEDAFTTSTPLDHLRNFASLITSGDLANGIYAAGDGIAVDNFGRIETSGRGAEGILIEGSDARVRNYGSIVTTGEPTDDFAFYNDCIAIFGDDFDVANFGNVSTSGEGAGALYAEGNGGRAVNVGSITTEGAFASGFVALGNGGVFTNMGRINTSGFVGNAMFVEGDGNNLRNFGTIETDGVRAFGLAVQGSHNLTVNYGTIIISDPQQLAFALNMRDTYNEGVNYGKISGNGIAAGAITVLTGIGNTGTNWGLIEDAGTGLFVTGHDALARNFGTIDALDTGLLVLGNAGAEALNAGHVRVTDDVSRGLLVSTGADGLACNTGTVITNGDGAVGLSFLSVVGGMAVNSGRIECFGTTFNSNPAAGIEAFGLEVVVRNGRTGLVEAHDPSSPAVTLNVRDQPAASFRSGIVAADTHARFENQGVVRAPEIAVLGGAGDETVINRGQIFGDVVLGAGDDTFVFGARGVLHGDLILGSGDDHVRVENGAGIAEVADFSPADDDVVDVSVFFSSFEALIAHGEQRGDDVYIYLDRDDVLILNSVNLAALAPADFFFD